MLACLVQRGCLQLSFVGCARSRADQRELHNIMARRPEPAVNPPFLGYRMEQALVPGDALRGTEKQVPVLAQGKMEQSEHLLLHIRFEVDQQVAAADQIEPGKGRVLEQILWGKGGRVAQRFLSPV